MKLPPDQLKIRLDAAIATLVRLTQPICLDLEAHVAVSEALWQLQRERALLDATNPEHTPRA